MKNKPCTKCGKVFPETKEFFCLDNRNKTGLAGRCRECDRTAQRTPRSKAVLRNCRLKSKYGITEKEYNKIFQQQKGLCAICGKHQSILNRVLSVDHNHKTNEVRGLLCNSCNLVLGWANDSKKILKQAIKYLGE